MKDKNTKHLKQRCIRVINSCVTLDQLKSAMNYAKLANVDNDKVVIAWYQFKYNLIGNI